MKVTKILAAVLATVLVIGCFAGCGSKSTKISEDGVKEYSAYMFLEPTPYNPDMPIWKAAEEKTGIRLISTVPETAADPDSEFNTMLTSKDIPNVIRSMTQNMRDLAVDGGLVPLDDLIEEHAPNLKAYFEKYPEAKTVGSLDDGHIYFIPQVYGGVDAEAVPSIGFMIRQDWLDKLGLEMPTTVEEYHDVLVAFANEDPNGNGKKDEIPFFQRSKTIDSLVAMFETSSLFTFDDKGKLHLGGVTENYRKAMEEISKWYKEGLIDKEIYTRTNAREQLLGQNLAGSTCDWFSSTTKFNDTFAESVPGINLVGMLPPKNSKGEVTWDRSRNMVGIQGWGLSVNNTEEELVDLIKYFDFWVTQEGMDLYNYGIEGKSYERDEDGNVVWLEEALKFESGIPNYLRSIGNGEIGTVLDVNSERSAMNEAGQAAFDMYLPVVTPCVPTITFNSEEQKIIDKHYANIKTAIDEQQQKWIMGSEPVNDATWNKYIKTLEGMNYKEVEKIYQAAYKRLYK